MQYNLDLSIEEFVQSRARTYSFFSPGGMRNIHPKNIPKNSRHIILIGLLENGKSKSHKNNHMSITENFARNFRPKKSETFYEKSRPRTHSHNQKGQLVFENFSLSR